MTSTTITTIFITNGTLFNYVLNDIDGNFYGNIIGPSNYSFKLNFSNTFEKQYNLTSFNSIISFWLNINGEIARVMRSSRDFLQIGLGGQRQSNYKYQEIQTSIFNRTLQIVGGIHE